MGLIKAALGAAGGVMADQWKEYFYCESIQKRATGRGSNTKGSPNVISNGSIVAVADGQCMCIVENGKVVDICAEPGEFVYDTSIAPSVFTGDLGENIKNTFSQIGKRFAFGGEAGQDQRVYYFNTKEIIEQFQDTNLMVVDGIVTDNTPSTIISFIEHGKIIRK